MDLSSEEKQLILKRRAEQAVQTVGDYRKLSDYTPDEKCAEFDKLYRSVEAEFLRIIREQRDDDDFEHWCYEAQMGLLNPRGKPRHVWDVINKVL